ncbi:hypothetical protein PENSPDRAFT_730726 [Peniophora sp. CONT]|nr:hypothetical protein PENSPDRAFT_730726 [Peniophora sp. CONT]
MVCLRSGYDSSVSTPNSTTNVQRRRHIEDVIAYHDTWRRLYAKRLPMAILDRRFRITKTNPSAPTLHFGLAFTKDNIMHCANTHQLLPAMFQDEETDPKRASRRFSVAIMAVKDYLERSQKVMLSCEIPLSPEGSAIFSLYSNYTRRRLRRPQTEKLILNFMREELNIDQDQEHLAKWYWDMRHGTDYVSKYAEFNL